jgi:hypothetical protein
VHSNYFEVGTYFRIYVSCLAQNCCPCQL